MYIFNNLLYNNQLVPIVKTDVCFRSLLNLKHTTMMILLTVQIRLYR